MIAFDYQVWLNDRLNRFIIEIISLMKIKRNTVETYKNNNLHLETCSSRAQYPLHVSGFFYFLLYLNVILSFNYPRASV